MWPTLLSQFMLKLDGNWEVSHDTLCYMTSLKRLYQLTWFINFSAILTHMLGLVCFIVSPTFSCITNCHSHSFIDILSQTMWHAMSLYFEWHCTIRASPPCRVKGTWQNPLMWPWRKNCPTPLRSAALIARALQTSSSTHYPRGWALLLLRPHSGASSTCDPVNRATFGNQVIFMIVFRE